MSPSLEEEMPSSSGVTSDPNSAQFVPDILRLEPDSDADGIRARTLARVRWIAILGQTLALFFVYYGLGLSFPLAATLAVQAFAIFTNIVMRSWYIDGRNLSRRAASIQLVFDLAHLTSLLFLTGGLSNPFCVAIIAPTTVSAYILPRIYTRALVLVALIAVTFLAFTPFPLPWEGPPPEVPLFLTFGVWLSLAITMVFLTGYVAQVGREGRKRSAALSATQLALEREQKLSALGTQAAAAAHELGTPLGSLLLILKDRLSMPPGDTEGLQEDLTLMVSEVERCRAILGRLRDPAMLDNEKHFTDVTAEALLREAAAPHEKRGAAFHYIDLTDGAKDALVKRSPGVLHGLRNVIENAAGFANTKVVLSYEHSGHNVRLTIDDDGPGFDAQIARQIGEPFITNRQPEPGRDGGMGLGLFISITLIEREGGKLRIARSPEGGGRVKIDLPLLSV